MDFEAAVIREQGVTFAVIIVKPFVLNDRTGANRLISQFQHHFEGIPVVLMAQDISGRPEYYGRPDIVRFMVNVPLSAIPWRKYRLN